MSGSQQYLMASMASPQASNVNGSTEYDAQYRHELVHQFGGACDSLHLEKGENWLRLVIVSSGSKSVLDDTQDTMPAGSPYPSILSLKEVGSIDAPTPDCYICIDVDGPFVAVKDMRALMSCEDSQDDKVVDIVEVFIQRRKFPFHEGNDGDDDDADYHPLEELPRRQLRILCPSDRICTRVEHTNDSENTKKGLVLKYKRETIASAKRKVLHESSQLSTQDSPGTPTRRELLRRITSVDSMESSTQATERTEADNTVSQLSNKLAIQGPQYSIRCEGRDDEVPESEVDDDVDEDDPDRTQVFPTHDIGHLATQSQSSIKAAVCDSDDETAFVGKESLTESMDQPTQAFSFVATPMLLKPIVQRKDGSEQKKADTFGVNGEIKDSKINLDKQSINALAVVDSGEGGTAETSGAELEGSKTESYKHMTGNDGFNNILGRDDGTKDKSGPECINTSIDTTTRQEKSIGTICQYAKIPQAYSKDKHNSERVAPHKILAKPVDDNAINAFVQSNPNNITEKGQGENAVFDIAHDGDADSDTTMLPDDQEQECPVTKVQKTFDDEKMPASGIDTKIYIDEEATPQKETDNHLDLTHEPGERGMGNHTTTTITTNPMELLYETAKEYLDQRETEKTQTLMCSPLKLAIPKEWESIGSPAAAKIEDDPIDEESSGTAGPEGYLENSDLTEPNNRHKATMARKGVRKQKSTQPRRNDTSSGITEKRPISPKIEWTVRKRRRPDTTSEESSFQQEPVSRESVSSKRRSRRMLLAPPFQDTTGPASATMYTKPEKQRSTRSHTPQHSCKEVSDSRSGSRSSRKQSRQNEADMPIRVLITGVDMTPRHKHMISAIGAELIENVEDAAKATHVIAGDDKNSLRRTPKVMIGVCMTSNILHMDWLTTSAKKRIALPCRAFLLLNDAKAEKAYGFKMRETLSNGNKMRQECRTLLNGKSVFICPGVAGNKAPPEKELKLIVEAAGGKWVTSAGLGKLRASQAIIITSTPPTMDQLSAKDVSKATKNMIVNRTTNWLFDCIMKQDLSELDLDDTSNVQS